MLTIGQHLRNARTGKNISVRTLSEKTKINQRIINSLENDNFSDLPSLSYLKCFIRSFSNVLDINETYTLNLLTLGYKNNSILSEIETIPKNNKSFKQILLNESSNLISLFKHFLYSTSLKLILGLSIFSYSAFNLYYYFEDYQIISVAKSSNGPKIEYSKNSVNTKKYEINVIASSDSSWITYKFEENKSKGMLLKKGEHLNFNINNGNIIIGNPKSITFYVNGKKINLKLHSRASGIAKVQLSETEPFIKTTIARALAISKNP